MAVTRARRNTSICLLVIHPSSRTCRPNLPKCGCISRSMTRPLYSSFAGKCRKLLTLGLIGCLQSSDLGSRMCIATWLGGDSWAWQRGLAVQGRVAPASANCAGAAAPDETATRNPGRCNLRPSAALPSSPAAAAAMAAAAATGPILGSACSGATAAIAGAGALQALLRKSGRGTAKARPKPIGPSAAANPAAAAAAGSGAAMAVILMGREA
mmetsp:Transcript_8942/g.27144  ORF Transcript_8942/g.27144 Transcript_8942/m.27144 type:complete len:212 (-) Transcript_8942:11-646(-)